MDSSSEQTQNHHQLQGYEHGRQQTMSSTGQPATQGHAVSAAASAFADGGRNSQETHHPDAKHHEEDNAAVALMKLGTNDGLLLSSQDLSPKRARMMQHESSQSSMQTQQSEQDLDARQSACHAAMSIPPVPECVVCQAPAKAGKRYCKNCYGMLYKHIKQLIENIHRSGARFDTGGSREQMLQRLREAAATSRHAGRQLCQGQAMCPPEAYAHTTPQRRRCARCRVLACMDKIPDLALSLLRMHLTKAVALAEQTVHSYQQETGVRAPAPSTPVNQAAQARQTQAGVVMSPYKAAATSGGAATATTTQSVGHILMPQGDAQAMMQLGSLQQLQALALAQRTTPVVPDAAQVFNLALNAGLHPLTIVTNNGPTTIFLPAGLMSMASSRIQGGEAPNVSSPRSVAPPSMISHTGTAVSLMSEAHPFPGALDGHYAGTVSASSSSQGLAQHMLAQHASLAAGVRPSPLMGGHMQNDTTASLASSIADVIGHRVEASTSSAAAPSLSMAQGDPNMAVTSASIAHSHTASLLAAASEPFSFHSAQASPSHASPNPVASMQQQPPRS